MVNGLDERDRQLLQALLDIAKEIRDFRIVVLSVVAPVLRNEAGMKTRESYLRTEEMHDRPKG